MNQLEAAGPLPDLVAESRRVLTAARQRGVVVRLAGGLAIHHLCPAAGTPPLSRPYADLDLAIAGNGAHRPLIDLMLGLGYQPEAMFNALNGSTRLKFNDSVNTRHVDVFVNAVRMCHVIDFKERLELFEDTLTPADLLLTKLQIVELNDKDVLDVMALLHDQELEKGEGEAVGIDTGYLENVWGEDWPLWRTCQLTLDKIRRAAPTIVEADASTRILKSVVAVQSILESGRKSLRWKLRARVGERIRWYELPEEDG
ncbi:MAG: hypothetical protein M3082_02755 [Candidatus Dormibacteraeota bacterium]|nr:hypothetical protein [Candidatus Dormibacteraeota bacterium]